MSQIDVPLLRSGFGQTRRADNWWVQPLLVFLGLSAFIVYSTWAALQGQHFRFGPYLSPFYSPELFGPAHHGWFGTMPNWMPAWVTAAVLILWAPGGFRVTCYYYRGAYYKAFWADPPSCTVGEPRKKYLGERSFPLVLQNIHRYFLYLALVFLVLLGHDVWNAFWFDGHFGIGMGTLVLLTNLVLLNLLHLRMPLLSPSGGRLSRSISGGSGPQAGLRLCELPEPAPHAVCMVQPVHGGVLRSVRALVFHGRVD